MKPVVVIIRDGWGHRPKKEFNAPIKGKTTYTNYLKKRYPHTLLKASGKAVGLPRGFMGNSEVGHMTIGSGRIINTSLLRIENSITTKRFFRNAAFLDAIENAKKHKTHLHLMGIIQEAGVHAHIKYLYALLDLCKKKKFYDVFIHIISDGRDSEVTDTKKYVKRIQEHLDKIRFGKIASISGRYFAMDRDKRWARTKKAYNAIVNAKSNEKFENPVKCFEKCYRRKEFDEFIKPQCAKWYRGIQKNDSVISYNHRTDRTRQITKAMIENKFPGWQRKPLNIHFVAMTDYYEIMSKRAKIAFRPIKLNNLLGESVSKAKMKQLRISETEKYAHVTFFFNGQQEKPYKGENRILIPSPKVKTYDKKPEMSVKKIATTLVKELKKNKYHMIIVNLVNGDMVGHTGDWVATKKAVNAVDEALKKIVESTLKKQGTALIFADHGNCEEMKGKYRTSHTTNLVPCILVNDKLRKAKMIRGKGLQDIAPTILSLLEIKKPHDMRGSPIFKA